MNPNKRNSLRDSVQNILITLLSFTAVFLFAQTQMYTLGRDTGLDYLKQLAEPSGNNTPVISEQASLLALPVRVAVTGPYGRYGSITITTDNHSEEFSPLGSLFKEALGSSQVFSSCSRRTFLDTLSSSSSVYYDFLEPLPLSILAATVETTAPDDICARHIIITGEAGNSAQLFVWDNEDRFFSCSTAVSYEELEKTVNSFELGNAFFALDRTERYHEYTQHLFPLTLFLPDAQPQLPVLTSSAAAQEDDALLSALAFNPRTKTRWVEASGTEVIVDGDRTLRLQPNGAISYQSGGSDALQIRSSGALPSLPQAAADTVSLLTSLCVSTGEARLCLKSISRSEQTTVMTFDYQFSGIPIRFSNGEAAAQVTLSGTTVSSLELSPRQYISSQDSSLLLPLQQVLGIAAQKTGSELIVGFADYGSGTTAAHWLAE